MNKLKRTNDYATKTYDVGRGFLVDVITIKSKEEYEAWIYHSSYGIKELMFGISMKDETYDGFLDLVYRNLEDNILSYAKWYMDYVDYEEIMDYMD